MNRSKLVAIITGAISVLLAIAYLIIVQLLDYRDMKPAPIGQLMPQQVVVTLWSHGE
ncbi:glucose-inhibited division protein A [Nostocales cyanobacterium LEGE 11386]|nr:glucose-inhibited division protein A [Nostocales cyanobacterium LEGE 11386]